MRCALRCLRYGTRVSNNVDDDASSAQSHINPSDKDEKVVEEEKDDEIRHNTHANPRQATPQPTNQPPMMMVMMMMMMMMHLQWSH